MTYLDRKTRKQIIFLVYGGCKVTPLYSSRKIDDCLLYMSEGGLSSIQCYTIRAMTTEDP